MRVRELADWLAATFEGDGEKELTGVAPLETAGAADLAFVAGKKALEAARASAAGCLIVPPDFDNAAGRTVIRSAQARTAFARSVKRLVPAPAPKQGVHPSAVLAAGVSLPSDVSVGPHASIGAGSRVGPGTHIGAGCAIGERVTIGANCRLHANVTIYDDIDIGDRTILHSGAVLGADGFGFVQVDGHWENFPQVGRVVVGNDVEIGANTCIDRAALGVTWIGDGVKLDNMVHVAHNCRIGNHVVVAAQTGFSGGVVVEDYAVIGGQVGIGDKARIESGAVLGSGSGVLTSKIVHKGQVLWGTPARPLKEYLEQLAILARLPEFRKRFAAMEARVRQLEEK